MKPEVATFDAELQSLIQNTDDTVGLVNRAGNNIAHETNLLNQLKAVCEQNAEARHDLLEVLTRPQRVPLSDTRREQLASSISGNLPRMFEGQQPRSAAHQPPPVPAAAPRHSAYPQPNGTYSGPHN